MDDVRGRGRRPDGRGARGRARRDRERHAQARLPLDQPARRPDHPRRGARPGPPELPRRIDRGPRGASSSTSASTSARATRVTDIDEHARHRRARRRGGPGRDDPRPHTVLWAAGVQASSFVKAVAAATGAETDKAGRIKVGPDLTIPGHPEIYVIGDAAIQPWKPDRPVPGVAQGGIQGGKYAAKAILARLDGETRAAVPLQQPRRGRDDRAAVGRDRHPAGSGRSGGPAGSSPGCCGSGSTSSSLIGFANRLVVLTRWGWSFLTHGRRLAPDHRPAAPARYRGAGAARMTRRRSSRPEAPARRRSPTTSLSARYEARLDGELAGMGGVRPGAQGGSSRSTPRSCRSSGPGDRVGAGAARARRRARRGREGHAALSVVPDALRAAPGGRRPAGRRDASRRSSAARGLPALLARPPDLRADHAQRRRGQVPRQAVRRSSRLGAVGASSSRSEARHSQLDVSSWPASRMWTVPRRNSAAPSRANRAPTVETAGRETPSRSAKDSCVSGNDGAVHPVAGEQEPSRGALVKAVEPVAGDGLGEVRRAARSRSGRPSGAACRWSGSRRGTAPPTSPARRPGTSTAASIDARCRRGPPRSRRCPSEPTIVTPAVRPSDIVTDRATSPDSGKKTRRTGAWAWISERSASRRTRSRSPRRWSMSRCGSDASSRDAVPSGARSRRWSMLAMSG